MSHVVTAFYATRMQADDARAALNDAGIDSSRIRLFDGGVGGPFDNSTLGGGPDQDFFETLTRMFMPSGDADLHRHRMEKGSVLLTAEIDEDQLDDAVRLLEQCRGLEAPAGEGGQAVRSYARNTMRG